MDRKLPFDPDGPWPLARPGPPHGPQHRLMPFSAFER